MVDPVTVVDFVTVTVAGAATVADSVLVTVADAVTVADSVAVTVAGLNPSLSLLRF